MKNKRRDFLKFTGLAGLTAAGASVLNGFTAEPEKNNKSALDQKSHVQHFNMSGYSAPKLEVVRIGFIGLGNRGPAHLAQVSILEGVDIKALCDLRPEKLDLAKKRIEKTRFKPDTYSGKDDWKKKKYVQKQLGGAIIAELFFTLYFIVGISISLFYLEIAAIPFQLLFLAGFGTVGTLSLRHALSR